MSLVYIVSTEAFGDLIYKEDFSSVGEDEKLEPVIVIKVHQEALASLVDNEEIAMKEDWEGAREWYRKGLFHMMRELGGTIQETARYAN